VVLGGVALVVIAASAALAVQSGAERSQTGLVRWFNHPPQPFASVVGAVNPLLRPVPLVLVALVLAGWVLASAGGRSQRLEVLRALVIACLLSELLAQLMKHLADQDRPLRVIPGLDLHGYPTSPRGNAYPSAHTAVVVAAVCGLWPWMRWPQRVAGVAVAALVACNRIYIGAHWPIDVIGGAAIGLLSGAVSWLIAVRWPIRHIAHSQADRTPDGAAEQ
jgi:membrane-associated phospholipid phosphatase